MKVNIALLTVTDTRTLKDDKSGAILVGKISEANHNLVDRKICKDNKKDIKKIYFDHDIIFSLKCGSIVNLLILFNNKPIGTINILHNENHYVTKDIKKIEDVTIFMIPFFLNHQHKMKKH